MTAGDLLQSSLRSFELGSRQSGRTERMLRNLPANATVVCTSEREAKRLEYMVRREDHRKDVIFRVCKPTLEALSMRVLNIRSHPGPLILDHIWEYQFWLSTIENTDCQLNQLIDTHSKRATSGLTVSGFHPYAD